VAFVVFSLAVAGFGPTVVSHLRQVREIEKRFDPDNAWYLTPSADPWARKLGASAIVQTEDQQPIAPADLTPQVNDVTVLSVVRSPDSDEATVTVRLEVIEP